MPGSKFKFVGSRALMGVGGATVILGVLEAILAFAGIKPLILTRDPMAGFAHSPSLFYRERVAGSDVYRTRPCKRKWFNEQKFPARKQPDTCRIFCVGGSTTYGRPYDDRMSFCRFLSRLLRAAEPRRNWEVVNAGGISYASYRVARLMQELGEYEPDLFIVYCGHNEFLEHRTYHGVKKIAKWTEGLRAVAMRLRLYAVTDSAAGRLLENRAGREELAAEVLPALDDVVGLSAYERDDELRNKIVAHFRVSIERMIRLARSCGAEIMFVMPASNLKDMSPFKSQHSPGIKTGGSDARHAQTQYVLGRRLFADEDYKSAKAAFVKAVDEDVCPLRMISPLQRVLRKVTGRRGITLVDYPALLEEDCMKTYGHDILGREYFHDHVHPTMDATFMLGTELFDAMCRKGIADRPDAFGSQVLADVKAQVVSKLSEAERGRAMLNLGKVLAWAGKYDESAPAIRRACTLLPEDEEAWFLHGLVCAKRGRSESAAASYRKALAIDKRNFQAHNNLGELLTGMGRFAEAEKHFRESARIKPDQVQAHYNLGNLLAGRKDFVNAEAAYRRALETDPDHVLVLGNLGNVLSGQRKREEAVKVYQRVLDLDPGNMVAGRNLRVVTRKAVSRNSELDSRPAPE
ncbi:MAG: tetratricopeptide repeat protein [Kiritimatiellia bacterium]